MKKILLSLMTLVLVLGLVGAGAFAYFSDTERSINNNFEAGTLDIGLANFTGHGQTGSGGDTWDWPMSALEPGAIKSGTLYVYNGGSLTVDVMSIGFDYVVTEGTPTSVSDPKTWDLDDAIKIQTATWGSYVIADSWGYALLNGKTLAELYALGEVQMYAGGNAVTLAPDEEIALVIIWECDSDADNGIQGDKVDITVTIKAEQR